MKQQSKENTELLAAFAAGWREGSVGIPYLLLKYYHEWKLTEVEVMLMIHVMAFMERERKDFPTLEELQARMTVPGEKVIAALQKLLKEGLISIDDSVDPVSGVQYEKYNFSPLLERLAICWYEEMQKNKKQAEPEARKDIFSIFEKEFGRPLTPMELESITGWIDKDSYPEELILAGLKEAVFAGKVHFRYIDRILLEWSRNRITTVEQAREHSQRFRSMR
ncbi:DnaD domain-containing protein [Paenibacillus sp. 32352]|uniref:DnaD domain-containing protein n=1 Tax=Paenibacillus sp. 32352 TaxID=1969111 RepID=UPI0009ACC65D|nr:DnaD domain protein [Paenibacillus sp. 32352]